MAPKRRGAVSKTRSEVAIDVIHYEFPSAIRTREGDREKILKRKFQVNIWDFGGQEIYHATHQFFLTRRSVYILVCDDRKEDTDFFYWLQVVELLRDMNALTPGLHQGTRFQTLMDSIRAQV